MKNILIDTDMGYDDIMAICLLCSAPNVNIIGISVTKGVSSRKRGLTNLFKILRFLKEDIPLFQDVAKRNSENRVTFPFSDRLRANRLALLNAIQLPADDNGKPESLGKLEKLIICQNRPLTLLCLAPLTNIALLLANPRVKRKIDRLVIMGGAVFVPGNVPPFKKSEYNFAIAPRAARTVFASKIPVCLVSLDTTRYVPAAVKKAANRTISSSLTNFLDKTDRSRPESNIGKLFKSIIQNNRNDLDYFYDPVAASVIVSPKLITKFRYLKLKITSDGQSVPIAAPGNQVKLVTGIDATHFYRMLLNRILADTD